MKKSLRLLLATITTISIALGLVITPSNGSEAAKRLKVAYKKTVAVNATTKLKVNMKAKFKSSNKKIATVNKKGVVKGRKTGKVKITVTAKKNKKLKVIAKITVVPKKAITNITPGIQNPGIQNPGIQNPIPTQEPATPESPKVIANYIGEDENNFIYVVKYSSYVLQMKLQKPSEMIQLDPAIVNDSNATFIQNKEIDGKQYVIYQVTYNNLQTEYMQMELPSLTPSQESLPERTISTAYTGIQQIGEKIYIVYRVNYNDLLTTLKIELTEQLYNILF